MYFDAARASKPRRWPDGSRCVRIIYREDTDGGQSGDRQSGPKAHGALDFLKLAARFAKPGWRSEVNRTVRFDLAKAKSTHTR